MREGDTTVPPRGREHPHGVGKTRSINGKLRRSFRDSAKRKEVISDRGNQRERGTNHYFCLNLEL